MKIILLLITVCFASMALTSCTNDESENDLDFLTPEEEQIQEDLKQENLN